MYDQYETLIKKIRRKRKITNIVATFVVIITFLACSPFYIGSFGEAVIDYKGINPIITIVLLLLILLLWFVVYVAVGFPLTTALSVECNPEKYLILNQELNKEKNLDHIYIEAYFYMGKFGTALSFAQQLIISKNISKVHLGLFNKARCEFFLNDFDSLRMTVEQYRKVVSNTKANQKKMDVYMEIQKSLDLLVAIADEDKEKVLSCRDIKVWNNSKATQGYVYYLKGIAAQMLGEREESVYRFMWVMEECDKTVFARLAKKGGE